MVWPEMGHEFPCVVEKVKPELGISPCVEEVPPLSPIFLRAIGFRGGTHGQLVSRSSSGGLSMEPVIQLHFVERE